MYPNKKNELSILAKHYGTDKATDNRTKGFNYLDVYDLYFNRFRDQEINILEIGVRKGPSLSVWKEYFPKANIFGIDIDKECLSCQDDRVNIIIGLQEQKSTIDRVIESCKLKTGRDKFDIIIDDGSHINSDIIDSLSFLWDSLEQKGVYIIEDLYNSYGFHLPERDYPTKTKSRVIEGSPNMDFNNRRKDFDNFLKDIITSVDDSTSNTLSVHVWDAICVILKT